MSLINTFDTFDNSSDVLNVFQFSQPFDFDTLENDIKALKRNKNYDITIKNISNNDSSKIFSKNFKSYSYSSSKHYEMKNGKIKRNEINEELNLTNNGKHYVVKRINNK